MIPPIERAFAYLALTLALAASLPFASAHAASFTVTTGADGADATPGDGLCATATGDCTLRAAIQEANALAGTDAITLSHGIYRINLGELAITSNLTLAGDGTSGTSATVISGNRKARVLSVSDGATVTISDLRIKNGRLDSGGGLLNNGTTTLTNVSFTGNRAKGVGATFGLGGGIYNNGNLQLTNVTFTGNRATAPLNSLGGGLYNNGVATLTNVTFTHNHTAGCGGAIYNIGIATLTHVTIERNHASSSGGGFFNDPGTAQLTDVTIDDNHAGQLGGGLFNYGSVTLTNATIHRNRAHNAGGIFSSYGTVTLTNVTISSNRAFYGGGIYFNFVYNQGSVTAKNTIIAANTPQNCATGPVTSLGHNLDSGSTCALSVTGDISNKDPMLGPLRNNGGFTETRAVPPGSPVIDSGDNAGCPSTDQCGTPRPADGNGDSMSICDIGAYEMQP